jgi:hypothetical protein
VYFLWFNFTLTVVWTNFCAHLLAELVGIIEAQSLAEKKTMGSKEGLSI